MRVVVIGGTGHIGTYLVPSLVTAGHDVLVISRGSRRPYRDDPAEEVEGHFDRVGVPYDVRERAFADRHGLMERF